MIINNNNTMHNNNMLANNNIHNSSKKINPNKTFLHNKLNSSENLQKLMLIKFLDPILSQKNLSIINSNSICL